MTTTRSPSYALHSEQRRQAFAPIIAKAFPFVSSLPAKGAVIFPALNPEGEASYLEAIGAKFQIVTIVEDNLKVRRDMFKQNVFGRLHELLGVRPSIRPEGFRHALALFHDHPGLPAPNVIIADVCGFMWSEHYRGFSEELLAYIRDRAPDRLYVEVTQPLYGGTQAKNTAAEQRELLNQWLDHLVTFRAVRPYFVEYDNDSPRPMMRLALEITPGMGYIEPLTNLTPSR